MLSGLDAAVDVPVRSAVHMDGTADAVAFADEEAALRDEALVVRTKDRTDVRPDRNFPPCTAALVEVLRFRALLHSPGHVTEPFTPA